MPPDLGLHTIKMDYSAIHKENEILEGNLEEHLVQIKKNQDKAMEEKVEQLDEIRREMGVITKLQEAVNARQPGESTDFLFNARAAVRFGRQWTSENKLSRAQMKIEAERNKFSSKSLFNVRRFTNSVGLDLYHSKKHISASAMQIPADDAYEDNYINDRKEESTPPTPQKPKEPKGYLKKTYSSISGFRPLTAGGEYHREQKVDDLLPPRSKSAVLRSRSRRQLELLCRVTPKENELEITSDFKIDWKAINEKRRRRKLQELKVEHDELENKVQHFLKDVELFNKRPISEKTSGKQTIQYNHAS